jgi:hypothetical protein
VLDGFAPARHTAVAPPSSARCRARYGRPSFPASQTVAVPTFFGIDRVVPRRALCDAEPRAGPTATARDLANVTRACLAALQGGQVGAHSIKTRTDQQVLLG